VNEASGARIALSGRQLLLLVGLLVLGLGVRLAVMPATGFPSDVSEVQAWAVRLREGGPWSFYEGGPRSVYPAVLLLLWPLSVLPDDVLRVAVKGLSIPFDLIIGALLFWVVSTRASTRYGAVAAGLYLFNPGIILAGPFWGQWDAIGTALFLGALIAADSGRMPAAGALAALATLAKPQFGLVGLVVLGLAAARAWRARDVMPILQVAAGGLVAAAVILLPLQLSPIDWLEQVNALAGMWPYTSLYAFNPWAAIYGFGHPDDGLAVLGRALLAVGIVASLVPLARHQDLATALAVGAFLVMAFYFLPTRAHERYLFPAFALLAPLAATRSRLRMPYLGMSLGFMLALLYMLSRNAAGTGVSFPEATEQSLFSPAGLLAIGVLLMGSTLVMVWRLLRGEMSLAPTIGLEPGSPRAMRRED
jgi:hypothetical protein